MHDNLGPFVHDPQPYPARPRWAGDFHQLEAALFSTDVTAPARRAAHYADAFLKRPTSGHRAITELPEIPSVRVCIRGV